jgi:ribonuclease VapC
MIAIDSSAVVTMIALEPGFEAYVQAVELNNARLLSAGNYLECAMVLSRMTGRRARLDEWIDHFNVEVVPVDFAQARLAADAFARYGRGQHPARLNYGDCFAYALAASRGVSLLYKGTDFGKTDIASALAAPA